MMQKHFLKSFVGLLLSISLANPCFAAVDFNGDADNVVVVDSTSLDTINGAAMSFSVWIRPDFIQTSVSNWIFDKSAGNTAGFRLAFLTSEDDFRFRLFTSSGAINADTTGLTWTAGTWHHLAGRYDGSNMYIYWDGVEESGGVAQTGNITTTNTNLFIGIMDDSTTSPFDGAIDDIAIWNADIGENNVLQLYNSKIRGMPLQIYPANLICYYSLDDLPIQVGINADTFNDLSGNGNTGTGTDADGDSAVVGETTLNYPQKPIQSN